MLPWKRLIVQLAEHTAHNGTDVGSNPAKPTLLCHIFFKKLKMEFNFKRYQKIKTRSLLKKTNFLFLSINTNQNAKNWLIVEQNLEKLSVRYHKTYISSTTKIFKKSAFKNLTNYVKSTFFFLKPQKIVRNNIIDSLTLTQFTILILKLNKKAYGLPQIKAVNSHHHKKNLKITYQFLLTALKTSTQIVKYRNLSE